MTVHGGVPGESTLQHAWIPGFERLCTESASSRMESGAMDSGFIHNPRFHAKPYRTGPSQDAKRLISKVHVNFRLFPDVHISRSHAEKGIFSAQQPPIHA